MSARVAGQTANTSVEASLEELPRESLGGFRLLRKLGTGGMATVYLGHRTGSTGASQFAAIKVMLPHLLADEPSVQLFLDEACITSSIRHPYVCRVLDWGVDDGLPYLATEYVMGEVLSDLVQALHASEEGQAAAPVLMAQVIAQVCEGLHAAHDACDDDGQSLDIVHRDMAPQNVIVGYDGHVRVLDFGIARSSSQLHETQQGMLRGRFGYMAPEQMEVSKVDRRADIWSLGVLLWEGVAGRRLFKRSNINRTMRAVIADPLRPMLRSMEGFPPALLGVVENSVARDVDARFATAHQMSVELSRYASAGAPHVAAWMKRAFPGRLEEKRRELREVTGAASSLPPFGRDSYPALARAVATRSGIRAAVRLEALPTPGRSKASPSLGGWRFPTRAFVAAIVVGAVVGGLLALDRKWPRLEPSASKERIVAHALSQTPPAQALVTQSVRPGTFRGEQGVQLGVVVVLTTGSSAHVQVDGRELGLTPIRIALPAGRHQLRVARDERGVPVWAPIDVQAGVTHMLEIPLEE